MANISGIRSAFTKATEGTSPEQKAVTGNELRDVVTAALADDRRIDFIERGEMRSKFVALSGLPADEATRQFDELMKAVNREGVSTDAFGLIDQAFASLHVREAPPHLLKGLPDGKYPVVARFLDQEKTFTIEKKGNGATINGIPIGTDGKIHHETLPTESSQRIYDGQVELIDGDILSIQFTKKELWLTLGETTTETFSGAAGLDGTSMLPEVERKRFSVSGRRTTVSRAAEGRGRTDTSDIAGEVELVTNSPTELFLRIPNTVGGEGREVVPVRPDGSILVHTGAGVWSRTISGRLEQGKLTLNIQFEGSTLSSSTRVEGTF